MNSLVAICLLGAFVNLCEAQGSRCPLNNDGLAVHIPHETECTLFYKCNWGNAVLQSCPAGLHFNQALQVCDWPWRADCDGNVGGSEGTVATDATVRTSTETVGTTTGNGSGNDCPPSNDGLAVHLPHANCSLFYKCNWGVKVEMSCPPGLHFNRVLQVCDWPRSAGCA